LSRARPRTSGLALGVLLAAAGCSLLVSGEPEPMRCALEGQVGPPACDPGLTCISGLCRLVEASGGATASGGAAPGGERP
jgi:hypothetical protein